MSAADSSPAISTHQLRHAAAEKICRLTLTDERVVTETGKVGKLRRTEKQFASAAEAATYFERQEWGLLKKGFVLHDPAAAPGQPQLHCYLGGGYTGSLALADTPAGTYVYQHGWFREPADQQDFLVHLGEAGQQLASIALPTVLAWDAHYQPAWQALVLDLDHTIFRYDISSGQFQPLSAPGRSPASFVATAGERTAFATNDELVVLEADQSVRGRLPLTTQVRNGTVPFAAALAGNGELLAVHTVPGELRLYRTLGGTLLHTFTGEFDVLRQVAFASDDQLLLGLTWVGNSLRSFDLHRQQEVEVPLRGGEDWPTAQACCLSADQSRLAVLKGRWVEVYDGGSWQLRVRFRLAHCVRTAQLRFMDDGTLGVRTDYGCFSRYRV